MYSSTVLPFERLAVRIAHRAPRFRVWAPLLGILLGPAVLRAQQATESVDSDKQTIQMLVRRVEQLEARVAQLEAAKQPTPPAPAPAPAPAESEPEVKAGPAMAERMDTSS